MVAPRSMVLMYSIVCELEEEEVHSPFFVATIYAMVARVAPDLVFWW
jgi:hypothetical protein